LQSTATRIDFYVLESTLASDRLRFVCRLCEKAYQAGHRIFLLTNSASQSIELDKLLWTFKNDAFLPHNVLGDSQQAAAPIIIGTELPATGMEDLLINLDTDAPAEAGRFKRIAEVIDASDNIRQAGRQRFSDYRAQGFAPETHKIGSN
jgi:DNA polymerase III subunit chi